VLRIATVNVNGLRAASRKGMNEWLAETQPDVVTLQEVRAPDELVAGLMGDGWHIVHAECSF
jgi:exodeoxyribonuclease-3